MKKDKNNSDNADYFKADLKKYIFPWDETKFYIPCDPSSTFLLE